MIDTPHADQALGIEAGKTPPLEALHADIGQAGAGDGGDVSPDTQSETANPSTASPAPPQADIPAELAPLLQAALIALGRRPGYKPGPREVLIAALRGLLDYNLRQHGLELAYWAKGEPWIRE
jgi:hypothetical protein